MRVDKSKKSGYVILVGGIGMLNVSTGLTKIGLEVSLAQDPEKFLRMAEEGGYDAIVLADNIFLAKCAGDKKKSSDLLLSLLGDLEKIIKAKDKKVWLITRREKQEAWNIFSRFEMIHQIVKSGSVVVFASNIKVWLELNKPSKQSKKQ